MSTTPPAVNPLVAFIRKYRSNPVQFVYEVLKCVPDEWQCLVLEDVANGTRKISIRSGHGVGKSTVLSWIMLWYLLTRYPVKIVVTAPTSAQLYDALFAELKRWVKEMPLWAQALLEVKADRVELLASRSEAFISFRTSRAEQPEALQGIHADNVLLIVDEASGVPEQVFEAGSGSMSGHNATTLLAGNPVRSTGFFFDTHNRNNYFWKTYHVSCRDSSRVSQEYIDEAAATYGEESNPYRVRVLGEFPLADDDTVIGYGLVVDAELRDIRPATFQKQIWGVDVARFGTDRTVLAKRRASVIETVRWWRGKDTMQVAGLIKADWDVTAVNDRPVEILVDVIGLGAGVCDRLRELGLPARGINVSESPAMGERFLNLRAELWWRVREWLETRAVKLCPTEKDQLRNELSSVRYKYTSNGKIQIESKDDMRRRKVSSPDMADAVVLTFASEAASAIHGAAGSASWGQPIKRGLASV